MRREKFRPFDDGAGYECLQLVGESFGRLGKGAACFLSNLVRTAASDSCDSTSVFVKTVQQELSAMCRVDASMYGRFLLALARGVGGVSCLGWRGQLTRLMTFSVLLSSFCFRWFF